MIRSWSYTHRMGSSSSSKYNCSREGDGATLQDGRKISIGDSALFQAGNSPPFIGIIRSLTSGKEDCPKLAVNWLYRPADLKLNKGIFPEAAPNEVFYSFHKDEISAASLLHPCKVAFLRKGVELPSGISSFVCRRVYDIQNRCLWWLTDQDYINERQEEVDQLLDRTKLEIHAALQSGTCSLKPLNGPTSTQQLKPSSDSVQNSTTSFPFQGKGRKRDKGDHGPEPIKQEHSLRTEDGYSSHCKLENMIKAEIAKITDKGRLVNCEGVDKLVHFMHLDRADKKIDLAGRIMLADIIAATDKTECLDRFVQLKGIPVLDDWLQESHKGKAGDSSNCPKENDKSGDELLIILLCALDKLPVNLHALQTSNVGKSVNNLRSHKNLEIQKKARSLVDTWKKRVDLEMKMNDAKSASSQNVSWPGKPGFSEVPHGANRRSGSSDVSVKGIVMQPSASKTGSIKLSNVDSVTKSTSTSPRSLKLTPSPPVSVTTGSKDLHCKVAGSSSNVDMPLMTIREEKSSSSSQSQNNSQSCSSDHGKNSYKEDVRSSNAGSMSAKTYTGVSHTWKSSNVSLGAVVSGAQKESALGKPILLNRKTIPDKSSQAGSLCERSVDMATVDHGNSPRLIVRFPNPGRSPARSASGGSFEDPSVIVSRASSPGVSDKQDSHDRKAKVKTDPYRTTTASAVNMHSVQGNDVKHGPARSDEGDRLHVAVLGEVHIGNNIENVKSMDSSKASCSSSGNEKGFLLKSQEPLKASFSIHAFIEGCVKYSEASSSLSVEDDNGMDLLASVAAGEMPKSKPVSPIGTSEMNSPAQKDTLTSNSAKSISLHDDVVVHGNGQLDDNAYSDSEKQGKSVGSLMVRGPAEEISTHGSGNILGENRNSTRFAERELATMHREEFPSSTMELHQMDDLCVKSDGELNGTATDGGAQTTCSTADETSKDLKEEFPEGEGSSQLFEKRPLNTNVENNVHGAIDEKLKAINREAEDDIMVDLTCKKVAERSVVASDVVCDSLSNRCDIEQVTASCINVEKEAIEESSSCLLSNEKMDMEHESLSGDLAMMKQLPHVDADHLEALDRSEDAVAAPVSSNQCHENAMEFDPEKAVFTDIRIKSDPSDVGWIEQPKVDHGDDSIEQNLERIEVIEHDPSGSALDRDSVNIQAPESNECMKPAVSKLSSVGAGENHEMKEHKSTAAASFLSNATGSGMAARLEFNLNEGISMDEVNPSDLVISTAAGCTFAVDLSSPMHHPVSPLHHGLHASITVATAAKGPFVHPDNLLRSKGEVRWKGSAATSAFRAAEPQKGIEMLLGTTDVTSNDTAAGIQSLPPLDIDLNMPVERVLEDMTSRSSIHESGSGAAINGVDLGNSMKLNSSPTVQGTGLNLDLNREDESIENAQPSSGIGRRIEVLPLPVRSSSSGGFCTGEVNNLRDFDLNNGPGVDEVGLESAPQNLLARACGPFPSHFSGLRMNGIGVGSTSSWFPTGASHPAVAVPSFLPDRAEQPYPFVATAGPQRILGSATGGTFGGELYRGPVFSSPPPMAFSPAASFPYAGFPVGNSFQMASVSYSGGTTTSFTDSSSGGARCFPAVPSQLVGTGGAVSSHHPRPYVISLPEGTLTSGGDGTQKRSRQGLDLNAGPGSTDVTRRDERLTSLSGQLSVVNLQRLPEEQSRIYHSTNGPLKRKEPEGGWDADRFYKSPSWQ